MLTIREPWRNMMFMGAALAARNERDKEMKTVFTFRGAVGYYYLGMIHWRGMTFQAEAASKQLRAAAGI